ncbi:VOC family protein [Polycladomyces sp. WAk]|uniref:VOC family protein n=1 Tax=Polycladomyces zharkentensis TaxID=2807616 RepID=A0ABS2WMR3_9BACL|nr:VOC family protein [Polycladomyces sp. WAk]
MKKITTFFMFDGKAEEAMNFYTSFFDHSEILSITRYGANEDGEEGTVKHATFSLCGQAFMCIDSSVKHEFSSSIGAEDPEPLQVGEECALPPFY